MKAAIVNRFFFFFFFYFLILLENFFRNEINNLLENQSTRRLNHLEITKFKISFCSDSNVTNFNWKKVLFLNI